MAGTGRLEHAPPSHPAVKAPKIGVLLANLGTPDGYDYWSMRRYLNEFLSDKRVVADPNLRASMAKRAGRTSVPQIFIGGVHVGGCDDLHALDHAGKLDAMLI
jgi:hypothetical protein